MAAQLESGQWEPQNAWIWRKNRGSVSYVNNSFCKPTTNTFGSIKAGIFYLRSSNQLCIILNVVVIVVLYPIWVAWNFICPLLVHSSLMYCVPVWKSWLCPTRLSPVFSSFHICFQCYQFFHPSWFIFQQPQDTRSLPSFRSYGAIHAAKKSHFTFKTNMLLQNY